MTQLELVRLYLNIADTSKDTLLSALLDFAKRKMLNRLYPYNDTITNLPSRYNLLQVQITVDLYNRMGAEGQVSHSENGISRIWDSSDVAKSLLSEIVPYVGVLFSENA